jgi:hypothetical protein
MWRPGAASYVNQSGNGCMGVSISSSGFSRTAVGTTLVWLVCYRLWWAYILCFGCRGKPCSNRCRLARVFLGCVLYRLCTLLCIRGGGCVPGLAVGCALTVIYRKRECWLVFLSASSCVFAIFAAVRWRIHSRLCLVGMVCNVDMLMLWRRAWWWCASRVCRLDWYHISCSVSAAFSVMS